MTNEEAIEHLKHTDACDTDLCEAEWIDNKCSNCKKGIENLIDSREWYENEKPNFCPFCGKKIVKKEVSE